MNNLSWMLYFSDALPKFAVALGLGGGAVVCLWILVSFFYFMEKDRYHGKTWPLISSIPFILLATLIPSQTTILLIAGSEAGEYVATSESGKAIISDVESAIRAQLSKLSEEDK